MKVKDILLKKENEIVQIAKFWGFPEVDIFVPIFVETQKQLNLVVKCPENIPSSYVSLFNAHLEDVLQCAVVVYNENKMGRLFFDQTSSLGLIETIVDGSGKNLAEAEEALGDYFGQELEQYGFYKDKTPQEAALTREAMQQIIANRKLEVAEQAQKIRQAEILAQRMQQASISNASVNSQSFFSMQQQAEKPAASTSTVATSSSSASI